jgi:hypothetical protein
MHSHETLLRRLFDRLAARDAHGAAYCYHPGIFYTNPLFPRLRAGEVCDFWSMVFEDLDELEIAIDGVQADDDGGHVAWRASYRFGRKRRGVTTAGRSMFAFRDGLVCRHYDYFSHWGWAKAALGPAGAALGWFGPFRWAVRQTLARRLARSGSDPR